MSLTDPPSGAGDMARSVEVNASPSRPAGAGFGEDDWTRLAGSLDPALRAPVLEAWTRLRARVEAVRTAMRGYGTPGALPAGGPPGGALPGEITRLDYPLRRHAAWTIRTAPTFEARVEGVEVLDLPVGRIPAFRVRLISELFDPGDRVIFWYSRWGFLGFHLEVETEATGVGGAVIGTLRIEDARFLDDLALERPGRFGRRRR